MKLSKSDPEVQSRKMKFDFAAERPNFDLITSPVDSVLRVIETGKIKQIFVRVGSNWVPATEEVLKRVSGVAIESFWE